MSDPDGKNRTVAAAAAFCSITAFFGLLLIGIPFGRWVSLPLLDVIGAVPAGVSAVATALLVASAITFVSGREPRAPLVSIGLSVALSLATILPISLGVQLVAKAELWDLLQPGPIPLILVLGATWLFAAAMVSRSMRSKDDKRVDRRYGKKLGEVIKGVWKFATQHRAVTGLLVYLYVYAMGYVAERSVLAGLNASVSDYLDPQDFAFLVLEHPVAVLGGLGAATLATLSLVLLLVVLESARDTKVSWKKLQDDTSSAVGRLGIEVLRVPVTLAQLLLTIPIYFVLASAALFPFALAWLDWPSFYERSHAVGRLTLSAPAVYADGVKQLRSTSTHLIAGLDCEPEEPDRDSDVDVKPLIVPWSAVASFDTTFRRPDVKERCPAVWHPAVPGESVGLETQFSQDGKEWASVATEDSRYFRFRAGEGAWQPVDGVLLSGNPGAEGEWLSMRFSEDGLGWNENSLGARYVQFRIGGRGAWKPPDGLSLVQGEPADSKEVVDYAVSFYKNYYRLSEDPVEQLRHRTELPFTKGRCPLVVAGCASEDGFLKVDGGRVVVNQPGDTKTNEAVSAEGLSIYREAAEEYCAGDVGSCVPAMEAVNGRLNCGLANLRGLAVVAGIIGANGGEAGGAQRDSKDKLGRLTAKHFGQPLVSREADSGREGTKNGRERKFSERHATLLAGLCPDDGPSGDVHVGTTETGEDVHLRAASPSGNVGHTCWDNGAGHNRAAVIRLEVEGSGGRRCLHRREARWPGETEADAPLSSQREV